MWIFVSLFYIGFAGYLPKRVRNWNEWCLFGKKKRCFYLQNMELNRQSKKWFWSRIATVPYGNFYIFLQPWKMAMEMIGQPSANGSVSMAIRCSYEVMELCHPKFAKDDPTLSPTKLTLVGCSDVSPVFRGSGKHHQIIQKCLIKAS